MTRRAVVTGIGVKTPAGLDVASCWNGLLAGQVAAAKISGFDTSDHPVKYACEIDGFDPVAYLGPKEARRADRVAQLGFGAAMDALEAAGDHGASADRCGVVAGTGIGGLRTLEDEVAGYAARGSRAVSPFLVPMMMPNATAALVALQCGFTGPNLCVATACAAGAHAIGEGLRLIRDGSADVVLAGGAEASITPVALAAFARMGALSSSSDPATASRPFDADRDGFVMGEGAAFIVLEARERAVARGATILGEVAGYGRTCDAHHITAPAPGGAGAIACMRLALADAGVVPEEIGHVNAHGTSTPLNDAAEAAAISAVFGEGTVAVTSTKGVTGHLIGAAGAVELIAALLAVDSGLVPPTANHERLGEGMTIDVVSGGPRRIDAPLAISNSFGFGGHNASLVVRGA